MKTIQEMTGREFEIELQEFLAVYEKRPTERNVGGLEAEGHFILWHVLKHLPKLNTVVESGVWHGISTWMIEQARPDLKVHICIDPVLKDMSFLTYTSPKAQYFSCDMTNFKNFIHPSETLVFLDDHVDVLPRLELCRELEIEHVLIDDNWHVLADHMTVNLYQKILLSDTIGPRFTNVMLDVDQNYEFPRMCHACSLFQEQTPHQNITYLGFKLNEDH